MLGTYHCAYFSTFIKILACPIKLTQIFQKETQKGTKHKAPFTQKKSKK
jgi:hypothetical protein